jgi:hypothetical protein
MSYTEVPKAVQLLDTRLKKLVVQEMVKSYLYYRVRSAGSMIKCYETIQVPMYVSPPQLGRWISYGDMLPDAQSSAVAMGEATNRFVVVPSGLDMLEQMIHENNPDKIYDIVDLKSAEVAWALRRTLGAGLWNGTGGKQPDGLATAIEKSAPGSQSQVVMGVDKSTKAWFRNKYVQLTSAFGTLASGSTIPAGFLALLSLIQQTTNGTLKPTDLITTQTIFEVIRRAMLEVSSPMHMMTEYKQAEMGFESFRFYGSHIAWDPNCPAESVYAIHLNELYDPKWTGDPRDKAKMDADLEDIGANSIFEVNGSCGLIGHPNIQMRRIAPRSPYRQLTQTEWIIHSMNWAFMRMADQGVAGSTGTYWGSWA